MNIDKLAKKVYKNPDMNYVNYIWIKENSVRVIFQNEINIFPNLVQAGKFSDDKYIKGNRKENTEIIYFAEQIESEYILKISDYRGEEIEGNLKYNSIEEVNQFCRELINFSPTIKQKSLKLF